MSGMTEDRQFVIGVLRRLADEARMGQDPEAHPTVEDLVAYHAGELPEGRGGALQEHLVLCPDCPELILALDGFTKLPGGEPGTPPAGLDSAWEEVRRRLAEEGWFHREKAKTSWSSARLRRSFLLPRNLLAAAAIVLVVSLAFFIIGSPASRLPRIVAQPESGAAFADLGPEVRGPVQEIAVPKTAERFFLGATPEGPIYPEYRVELLSAEAPNRLLWSGPWHPSPGSPDLFLQIPRGFLSPGEYRLGLRGIQGGHPERGLADERRFRLTFR
jgi:hypothetical protein